MLHRAFNALATWTSKNLGSPYAFCLAVLLIVLWGATGPFFHYSEIWQLLVNTGTTIATFLMVFLLQNSQNRTNDELQAHIMEMSVINKALLEKLTNIEETVDEEFGDDHED